MADAFQTQDVIDRLLLQQHLPAESELEGLLRTTTLTTLPRLMMGIDPWLEPAAASAAEDGHRTADVLRVLATGALCDRHFAAAERLFEEAAQKGDPNAIRDARLAAKLRSAAVR